MVVCVVDSTEYFDIKTIINSVWWIKSIPLCYPYSFDLLDQSHIHYFIFVSTDIKFIVGKLEERTCRDWLSAFMLEYVKLRSKFNTLHQQSHRGIKEWDPSSQVPPFCQHCSYNKDKQEKHKLINLFIKITKKRQNSW